MLGGGVMLTQNPSLRNVARQTWYQQRVILRSFLAAIATVRHLYFSQQCHGGH